MPLSQTGSYTNQI
ncbi:hypothetical protein F383_21567 [Gossypium arboreum]|uniref:Uncharacterized protein n=2 Tax=Gossypium arboreum TaxID=29729 RepID=A0A0B0NYJ4_GOSAR|nr:hypothetical protein F383_21567 [Gossypium arboreum]